MEPLGSIGESRFQENLPHGLLLEDIPLSGYRKVALRLEDGSTSHTARGGQPLLEPHSVRGGSSQAIKTSLGEKIVESWDECVQFRDLAPSNAKFKKFSRIEDAQEFLRSLGEIGNAAKSGTPTAHPTSKPIPPEKEPVPSYKWACPHVIAYTDGSFNSSNGYWGYGVVIQDKQGRELSVYSGNGTEFASSRNVAGAVHGAIRAIQSAIQQGCQSILIFHDYEGISAWAEGRWKAKLPLTIWYKNKVDELRKQIDISFRWVPGHKGVAGNERADGLAKKACFGFNLHSS